MNVNDLCAASYDANQSTEIYSTSEQGSVATEDTASTALISATNTTATQYTLPPLSQQYLSKQRLPSLVGLPSTYETVEDTPMTEASDTGDTWDMKKLIDKCSNLCHNLARYKTLQKDCSENDDQETTFDYITHTTHDILDSLVAMQQQREAVVLNEAEYNMIRQARNWKENRKPKYRRRSKRSIIGQRCHSCHTSETPEWRRGPDGARTLCNACGLHYSKLLRKESVTVSSCKILTNGSSNSHIKQIEQPPSDLPQRPLRIHPPPHPSYESQQQQQQQQQIRQQAFQRHSPIPLPPPLSSSTTDASTSSPSSSSTSTTNTSTSSSSPFQPTTTSSHHRPSSYHLTQ